MKARSLHLGLLRAVLLVAALGVACDFSHKDDWTTEPCEIAFVDHIDPCEPDEPQISLSNLSGGGGERHSAPLGEEPVSLASMLADGYDPPAWVTHLVVRGIYRPDTVRCTSGDRFRLPDYLVGQTTEGDPAFKCYMNVSVQDYIVGSGPTNALTVMVVNAAYRPEEFRRAGEQVSAEIIAERIEDRRREVQDFINRSFTGREHILMLGPDPDISSMALRMMVYWDVQRQTNPDKIVAVHPHRDRWREEDPAGYQQHIATLEVELPALSTAVTAAHDARVTQNGGRIGQGQDLPMLVTNANDLRQYYEDVGAFAEGTPEPAQPPPPCGLTIGNVTDHGLMQDCIALLAAKDTLRGSGTLNWSYIVTIAHWDGLTTGRNPSRVTKVELDDEGLTGTIATEIGSLSGLTHLDLSDNSLTGSIPVELGLLEDLQKIRLSGNSLIGCIPIALEDVATNDLSSLGLLYCQPPAPAAPTAGTPGEGSVPLSWTAVANTGTYRVEYREVTSATWTVHDDTITTTGYTVDGLQCDTQYEFRVSAYGSGTTYAAVWSDPSDALTASTGACTPPAFTASTYSFPVKEDAAVGDPVGTVLAIDAAPVTYAITAKSTGNVFTIDDQTGEITVAAALDYETTASYILTVVAGDNKDGTDWSTVTITVTDVAEGPPPAPTGLSVTLADGTFTLIWDAVTGAGKYEVQRTTDASDAQTITWTALPEVTTTTTIYTPTDGPACSTTYRFRVQSFGDGDAYTTTWGTESGVESVETATCAPSSPRPPTTSSSGTRQQRTAPWEESPPRTPTRTTP